MMEHPSDEEIKQQEQRAFLRERYLRLLTAISDHHLDITIYGIRQTKARFGSMDVDGAHLQLSDLETPIGIQSEALLRTSDVVSFKTTISPNIGQ